MAATAVAAAYTYILPKRIDSYEQLVGNVTLWYIMKNNMGKFCVSVGACFFVSAEAAVIIKEWASGPQLLLK